MSEEEKLIKLYEMLHGALGSSCYWSYDEENPSIICMKDGNECWAVTREELTFEFITKDF